MNTHDQAPSIFHFDNDEIETHVRVVMQDDAPLFLAKDVCDALGIANSRDAVSSLQDDELVSVKATSGGQSRAMQAVTESGFYALVFKSRKDSAQKFRKWVTAEVLPAIRRAGRYDPEAHLAELAKQLPPLARRGLYEDRLQKLETEVQFVKKQLDLCMVIPGQYSPFHWMLLQGWEPGRGECGRHSGRCVAVSRERGLPIGTIKEFEHCGQVVRVCRTAKTFDPIVLKEVIGEAA